MNNGHLDLSDIDLSASSPLPQPSGPPSGPPSSPSPYRECFDRLSDAVGLAAAEVDLAVARLAAARATLAGLRTARDAVARLVGEAPGSPPISPPAPRRTGRRSRFVGVYWKAARGQWITQVNIGGSQKHLGCFDDEEEAARARDRALIEAGVPIGPVPGRPGRAVALNFPESAP